MTSKKEWKTIQKDYTHGITLKNGTKHYPTLQQLSNTYNVTLTAIKAQAARNHWTQKRKEAKMRMGRDVFVENKLQDCEVYHVSMFDVECVNAELLNVVKKKLEKYRDDVDFLKSSELRAFANVLETISRITIASERLEESKDFEYEDKVEIIQKIVGSRKWRDNALKMK